MSNKVQERRERKIKEAIKAKNWDEVTRLLQQEQSNAERRDRYHNRRIKNETIASKNAKKSVRYDVIASSDLNPEEALILEELRQAIREAKASLSEIDSKIVEMIAEQGSSYKETARYITEHYKKMSDVTVKSHYCKALKKLAPLLKAYR
ncbi:TPA: RNA polymerase sigma factor [Streptococcus agalactiae]